MEGIEEDRETMKKAFVFILEVQVHNERKTVKTGNELLSFILEVYNVKTVLQTVRRIRVFLISLRFAEQRNLFEI